MYMYYQESQDYTFAGTKEVPINYLLHVCFLQTPWCNIPPDWFRGPVRCVCVRAWVLHFVSPSRNLYNEWVLCAKKADEAGEGAEKCKPKRHNALAICPDEWVSFSYCCTVCPERRKWTVTYVSFF